MKMLVNIGGNDWGGKRFCWAEKWHEKYFKLLKKRTDCSSLKTKPLTKNFPSCENERMHFNVVFFFIALFLSFSLSLHFVFFFHFFSFHQLVMHQRDEILMFPCFVICVFVNYFCFSSCHIFCVCVCVLCLCSHLIWHLLTNLKIHERMKKKKTHHKYHFESVCRLSLPFAYCCCFCLSFS